MNPFKTFLALCLFFSLLLLAACGNTGNRANRPNVMDIPEASSFISNLKTKENGKRNARMCYVAATSAITECLSAGDPAAPQLGAKGWGEYVKTKTTESLDANFSGSNFKIYLDQADTYVVGVSVTYENIEYLYPEDMDVAGLPVY